MASTISCASCSDDLSPSIHRMLRLAYLIAMSGGWALRVYDERQFAQTTRSRVARPLDNWAGARDQPADARRDAVPGQFVCFRCPGAGALDQESPGSSPGGAIAGAARQMPAAPLIAAP